MRDFLELTKPRITALILICTAVGYLFGCRAVFHFLTLLHALLGTALMASGTSALNQWYEADSDARMHRTRGRPIPAGRMKRSHGFVFGVLLSTAGFVELWVGTNVLAAALGLFTLISYMFVYTPLKQRSPACTTVGALPGAMPPLIGYAAASGVKRGAYVLADAANGKPDVILMATGSEVGLCVEVYEKLTSEGIAARVVSMPSWELFEHQPEEYRAAVLPPDVTRRVAVEQASTLGWERYTGLRGTILGMKTFGASAPLKELLVKFGFTGDNVYAAAKQQLSRKE